MDIRNLSRITFGLAEARYLGAVLHEAPTLSLSLSQLCTTLDEVFFAISIGAVAEDDFEAEITAPIDVLQELVGLFAHRTARKDLEAGLDPDTGYSIAEALSISLMRALRYAAFPTREEADALAKVLGLAL